jgi:hypothetical protein
MKLRRRQYVCGQTSLTQRAGLHASRRPGFSMPPKPPGPGRPPSVAGRSFLRRPTRTGSSISGALATHGQARTLPDLQISQGPACSLERRKPAALFGVQHVLRVRVAAAAAPPNQKGDALRQQDGAFRRIGYPHFARPEPENSRSTCRYGSSKRFELRLLKPAWRTRIGGNADVRQLSGSSPSWVKWCIGSRRVGLSNGHQRARASIR